MAQNEDLKFLRAAFGAPTSQDSRERTYDEGQEEQHRGIVDSAMPSSRARQGLAVVPTKVVDIGEPPVTVRG